MIGPIENSLFCWFFGVVNAKLVSDIMLGAYSGGHGLVLPT